MFPFGKHFQHSTGAFLSSLESISNNVSFCTKMHRCETFDVGGAAGKEGRCSTTSSTTSLHCQSLGSRPSEDVEPLLLLCEMSRDPFKECLSILIKSASHYITHGPNARPLCHFRQFFRPVASCGILIF